jgi:hypothetical protein
MFCPHRIADDASSPSPAMEIGFELDAAEE